MRADRPHRLRLREETRQLVIGVAERVAGLRRRHRPPEIVIGIGDVRLRARRVARLQPTEIVIGEGKARRVAQPLRRDEAERRRRRPIGQPLIIRRRSKAGRRGIGKERASLSVADSRLRFLHGLRKLINNILQMLFRKAASLSSSTMNCHA